MADITRLMGGLKLTAFVLPVLLLVSCKPEDDEPKDYQEWMNRNVVYVGEKQNARGSDGKLLYQTVTPTFAPGTFTLMRWHNDRSITAGNLTPLDNSTVKVNYQLHDIDGTLYDSGAGAIFRPMKTVVGFWTALTNMQVGDSVTAIVPYQAGYGAVANGNIQPYTTLIFSIRLLDIPGYEIKH